jgi:hypothetical protein
MIYDILSDICGLVGIVISAYKLIRIIKSRDISGDWLNGIWLSGLIAFLIGLIGQLVYIADMFEAVSEAKEPDINAIADGLSKATLNSLNGLLILTILIMCWGLLKGLITYRKTREV